MDGDTLDVSSSMANLEWLKIIWSILVLLSGGAMGAIIKIWFDNIRYRTPTIGIEQSINSVNIPLDARVTYSIGEKQFHFDNLYIVTIEIRNSGRNNFPNFDLKIKLPDFAKAVNAYYEGEDASQEITLKERINFENPSSLILFDLNPFNRKRKYHISLFVTCDDKKELTTDINLSSKIDVKFMQV